MATARGHTPTFPDCNLEALLAVLRGHPPPNTLFSRLKPHQKHSHPHTANQSRCQGGLGTPPQISSGGRQQGSGPRGASGARDTPKHPQTPNTRPKSKPVLLWQLAERRRSQDRPVRPYKEGVGGSSPSAPTRKLQVRYPNARTPWGGGSLLDSGVALDFVSAG